METKKENKIKNFFKAIRPFIRGTLKALPFGSAIVEISDNIKTERELAKGNSPKRIRLIDGEKKLPHNWISILFQLIIAFIIVYSFVTKQITINDVLNYYRIFLSMFGSSDIESLHTLNSDTLNIN